MEQENNIPLLYLIGHNDPIIKDGENGIEIRQVQCWNC